jgi:hypothetical protein
MSVFACIKIYQIDKDKRNNSRYYKSLNRFDFEREEKCIEKDSK